MANAGANKVQVGLAQAGAHGLSGGIQSWAQGGNFGSGFLSGGVSSGIGSLTSNWSTEAQLLSGIAGGGLASLAGGGSFWDGVKMGAITVGLNHLEHSLFTDPSDKQFVPAKDRPKIYEKGYVEWVNSVSDNTTISYTFAERLYLMGKYATLALPTSRVATTFVADDFIRYSDKTLISNQLIKGPGAAGAQRVPAIKGGGTNPMTGKSLPYHFHIHKSNWYKPWTWFDKTPIIKTKNK